MDWNYRLATISVAFFILICSNAYGQISELGFGIGGLTYTGDLQRGYRLANNRPAATAFFRTNLSDESSIRVGLTMGSLQDSDYNPLDPFATARAADFSIFLFEASTVFEYHFLDFRQNSYQRWTPYLFGGIGLFGFSGEGRRSAEFSNIQATLPFGAGVKYILNPLLIIGLEFGPRKTFFDYVDNVSEGNFVNKNFQYGNKEDNDVYYFLGITLTYSFYKIPCPYPNSFKRSSG